MICPVCKTNNINGLNLESCIQCGSDLQVHQLLARVREEIQMNNAEPIKKKKTKKPAGWFLIFQTIPAILLLICTIFGIFIGMRFLAFLDRAESQRSSLINKWSETGFEQLQQMNTTIKQELDLIIDERRENQALQAKLELLTMPALKNKTASAPFSYSR